MNQHHRHTELPSENIYIDTVGELDNFCAHATTASWLGLDTEFMRVRTYYPQLCLLQVSTPEVVACIDPKAIGDLAPIYHCLRNSHTTVLMHAARQDMELLLSEAGTLPDSLFDTQLAAAFCGYGDQIGYAGLVQAITGVELGKAFTRTDWCKRPLSAGQVSYAEDDVRYLGTLYEVLSEKLQELGREEWFAEDNRQLLDADLYRNDPAEAWRRIKVWNNLDDLAYARVMRLAEWREATAQLDNLPRNWVMRDPDLLRLAGEGAGKPSLVEELISQKARRRKQWVNELHALLESTPDDRDLVQAARRKPQPPSPQQQKRADKLMQQIRDRAEKLDIPASLLATRRDVNQWVTNDEEEAISTGWRRELLQDMVMNV